MGIIVPEQDLLKQLGSSLGLEGVSFHDLCQNEKVVDAVQKMLDKAGKEAGIFGFEKVRKVHLHPESFEASGLLTTTFKLKRNVAKNFFKPTIDQMYGKGTGMTQQGGGG